MRLTFGLREEGNQSPSRFPVVAKASKFHDSEDNSIISWHRSDTNLQERARTDDPLNTI